VFNLIKMALIQLNTNDPANIYHAQTLMYRGLHGLTVILACRLNLIVLSGIVPPRLKKRSCVGRLEKTKGRDIPGVAFN
jgi:hypothetical protein